MVRTGQRASRAPIQEPRFAQGPHLGRAGPHPQQLSRSRDPAAPPSGIPLRSRTAQPRAGVVVCTLLTSLSPGGREYIARAHPASPGDPVSLPLANADFVGKKSRSRGLFQKGILLAARLSPSPFVRRRP